MTVTSVIIEKFAKKYGFDEYTVLGEKVPVSLVPAALPFGGGAYETRYKVPKNSFLIIESFDCSITTIASNDYVMPVDMVSVASMGTSASFPKEYFVPVFKDIFETATPDDSTLRAFHLDCCIVAEGEVTFTTTTSAPLISVKHLHANCYIITKS